MHQAELAALLGKNQSFISNIERGQRRVDVLEFCAIAIAINRNPVALFTTLAEQLPEQIDI